jgi:hypothetical protein
MNKALTGGLQQGQPHLSEEELRQLEESVEELAQELERRPAASPPASDHNGPTP